MHVPVRQLQCCAREKQFRNTMRPVQIGEHCNDACIVEWLIPYLLNFVVPETTSATRGSAMSRYPVTSDALARGVALRHLGRMWGRLVELPRSEWGLFNAYLVPACSAAPSAVAPMLRRDLFLSLPGLATAARRLSVVSIGALPETPAGVMPRPAVLPLLCFCTAAPSNQCCLGHVSEARYMVGCTPIRCSFTMRSFLLVATAGLSVAARSQHTFSVAEVHMHAAKFYMHACAYQLSRSQHPFAAVRLSFSSPPGRRPTAVKPDLRYQPPLRRLTARRLTVIAGRNSPVPDCPRGNEWTQRADVTFVFTCTWSSS